MNQVFTSDMFADTPGNHRTTYQWLTEVNPKLTGEPRIIAELFASFATAFDKLPKCAERSAGERKLLEAKDCFVRASLPDEQLKTEEAKFQKFSEREGYSHPDDGNLVGRD